MGRRTHPSEASRRSTKDWLDEPPLRPSSPDTGQPASGFSLAHNALTQAGGRRARRVKTIADLMTMFPRPGRVEWIGVRPARHEPLIALPRVEALVDAGLRGDRYAGGSGRRGVTLIQAEHLPVIAGLAGTPVEPALVRRNIAVSGINLLALKRARFRLGEALLEGTGPCEPCSRMELALGPGGYNAMRGHGGITACVLEPGWIGLGDALVFLSLDPLAPRDED
jgi:MOSC domain-containing protein YiiM